MKNTLNFIIKPVLLLVLIAFTGCEKDLYEDSIKDSSRKLTIKKVSLKNEMSKSNHKLSKALNILNQKKNNELNRIVYDSIFNFYYDDENGLYIEGEEKNSYTFPVYRNSTETNDKVENLLFNLNDIGEYDIYLVRYNVSSTNLSSMTVAQYEQIEKEFIAIQVEGRATLDLVCVDTQEYQLVSDSSGNSMSTIEPIYYWSWVTTSSQCGWVTGNTNPINTIDGGGVGGDTSGSHSGGGTSSNSGSIYTGPVS